jgi:glycosyltransferase involved in cell wall biosynthesis
MTKLTVLMPVYNGERFLREAIESILQQTWADFEFLIVNDASTDGSRDIITSYKDPRIRLIDNPVNLGQTASLNRGLELASGYFIARQDQDDISLPDRLEKQVSFLEQNPSVALLGTGHIRINQDGKRLYTRWSPSEENHLEICWRLLTDNVFAHSSVVFRRDIVWQELGGYNGTIVIAQDYDLWSKIARRHEVHILNRPLVCIRYHNRNASVNYPSVDDEIYPIILENLRHFLQTKDIPQEWPYTIRLLYTNAELRDFTPAVFNILDSIYARFCQLYPEARENFLMRRHQARLFGYAARRAGYCLDRKSLMQAVVRSLRLDAGALGWRWLIGLFGLWAGGRLVRDFYLQRI